MSVLPLCIGPGERSVGVASARFIGACHYNGGRQRPKVRTTARRANPFTHPLLSPPCGGDDPGLDGSRSWWLSSDNEANAFFGNASIFEWRHGEWRHGDFCTLQRADEGQGSFG